MKTFIEFQNLPASSWWFLLAQSFLHSHRQPRLKEAHATFTRRSGPRISFRVRLMLVGEDGLSLSDATAESLPEAWNRACEALDAPSLNVETHPRPTSQMSQG